jgi:hypothetical protein
MGSHTGQVEPVGVPRAADGGIRAYPSTIMMLERVAKDMHVSVIKLNHTFVAQFVGKERCSWSGSRRSESLSESCNIPKATTTRASAPGVLSAR